MLSVAATTGIAAFLVAAIVRPLDRRYRAWKANRPEVMLYRDWRGRLVPDLRIKRIERTILIALGFVFVAGLVIDFIIEMPQTPARPRTFQTAH